MKTKFSPRTWAALTLLMIASAIYVGCATTLEERNPASATCSTDGTSDQNCDEGYVKHERTGRISR